MQAPSGSRQGGSALFGEMKGGEWTTLEVEAAGLGYDVVTSG